MDNVKHKIELPEKPLFLLTVDTEEEWDWSAEFPKPPFSTANIAQIPSFQAFCAEVGIRPTYFVDYAVADSDYAVDIIKRHFDNGECDVGAHLHPWANPPISEPINEHYSHAINLPISSFKAKIEILTEKLTSSFGIHPYSYRAGRWGINAEHLDILADIGYRVDSSVRPFYKENFFNYKNALTKPYWPSFEYALTEDKSQTAILEIPTTSGFTSSQFELLNKIHDIFSTKALSEVRMIGILWHLGILRKITVTPEGHNANDICQCIDAAVKRGDRVINMFFHSSDLLPGCTQYVKSESEKQIFLDCIKKCVDHMKDKHNAEFTTMREVRKVLTGTI